MSNSNVITARLDDETLTSLDRLAQYHERSRAWLVAKAVSRFVKEESEFFAFLEEGREAVESGDFVTHDELTAELRKMTGAKRAS